MHCGRCASDVFVNCINYGNSMRDKGSFPFDLKCRTFRLVHQMERTISVCRPEYSGPALKVVHFDRSGHFGRSDRHDKIAVSLFQAFR